MSAPKNPKPGRKPQRRRFQKGAPAWSQAEDSVLELHYAKGGTKACRALLPARTDVAIMRRARRLGIPNGFAPIRRLDEQQRAELEALALGRVHGTVEQLADRLGISKRGISKRIDRVRARHFRTKSPSSHASASARDETAIFATRHLQSIP